MNSFLIFPIREALKVLTEVRQNALMNSFIDALTRGGPGGLPRPIEMHAHDPTRYVGDMLAWVHQAMAGERELLEGLFDVKGDGRMMGSVRKLGDTEEEQYIQSLLDTDLEKLCMPLKVSIAFLLPVATIHVCLGSSAANCEITRREHHVLQDCKPPAILYAYYCTDDWGRSRAFPYSKTVSSKKFLKPVKHHSNNIYFRVTDVAYQVFLDTIEAQGRSLLRFLHVRTFLSQ